MTAIAEIPADIERRNLLERGTKAIELKPSSIVAAAKEDIKRCGRNATEGREAGHEYWHYAFHRRHVHRALKAGGGPKEIITIALGDLERGRTSGKHWTRVIYKDEALLRQALEVC